MPAVNRHTVGMDDQVVAGLSESAGHPAWSNSKLASLNAGDKDICADDIDVSYTRPSPMAMSRPRSDLTESEPLLDAEAGRQ